MNFKSVFQNFYSMNSLYIILQIIFFIENAYFASGVKKDQEKGLDDVKNPLNSQEYSTFHSTSEQAKSMAGGRSMFAPIKAVKKPIRKGKMVAEKAKKRPKQIVVKKPIDMPELPEIFMKPDVWEIVLNELQNDHKLPVGDENIRIKAAHMATLRDGHWLNDEVINGYMHLLTKNHQRYVYINTFHAALYISKSILHISWLNRINFERKLPVIFVPAHLNGNHWALAFISFAHKTIMIFDSMRLPLNVVTTKLNSKKVTKTHFLLKMFTLVKDIYEIKGRQQQIDGWEYKLMKKIPVQGNTDDCGVFILGYAKYLVDLKRITFTQEHIPYFRRLICSELMETVEDASEASNIPAGVNPSISQKYQMPAAVHLLDIPSKMHLPKHLDGIITASPKITSTVSEWKKIYNLYIGGKNELNLSEDTKVKDNDKGKGKIVEEGNIPLVENIPPPIQEGGEDGNGPSATQNKENNFDEIDFGKLNLNEIRRTIASLDEDLANHGNSPTTIDQQFNQADHQSIHQSSFNFDDPNLMKPFTVGNLPKSDLASNVGQQSQLNKREVIDGAKRKYDTNDLPWLRENRRKEIMHQTQKGKNTPAKQEIPHPQQQQHVPIAEPKFPQNMYLYQIQMEGLNNKLLNNINKNEEVTADLQEIENDLNGKNEENLSDFEKLLARRRLELIAEKEVLEAEEKKLNEEIIKLKQN